MSDDLARARARKAAGEWLARHWPNGESHFNRDALILAFEAGYAERIHRDVLAGDELALTAIVLDEASRGGPMTRSDCERAARAMLEARDRIDRLTKEQEAMADEHTIRVATGQGQLDDARALMIEAAEQFRRYEAHHIEKVLSLFGTVPDDPVHATAQIEATKRKIGANALLAARLEAWVRGDDQYPVSVSRDYSDGQTHVTYLPDKPGAMSPADQEAQESFVSAALDDGVDQISEADEPPNPIDILREVAEGMVDGEVIKGVDGPSFDLARDYMDQPVEISALDASPFGSVQLIKGAPLTWDGGSASLLRKPGPLPPGCHCSDICMAPVMMGRQTPCRRAGGVPGQKAPPAPERVRVPGVITEARQEITYEIEGEEGLDLTQPIWINGVPYLPARQFEAKAVLAKAEILIGEASDFIRGVTGANPGSDSAEMCQRLDAWPLSLATDAPTTKED